MAVSAADKKKLGKWIKQSREKKQPHLSQRQLALAVDITNASLSSIESGMIFPSEELLLRLIEQLQPPPELREKMLVLFAKAKGTSPPDINAELSKNPKLWGLIRQLIAVDPSEEQITQIEQLIYAGISASGGTTNDIESTFRPYKGQRRKPGTGCVSQINENLWEGRYSPKLPNGDRLARNVYTHSEKECEQKLAELIVQMKAEIAAQRQQPQVPA